MLLPLIFRSLEEDYWHLCESVQVWDVSCQRQVEITGPDTQKLVQLMTPRDLSQAELGQCFYAPLCDETGGMINDPILIKHSNNHWWLSISDSDVMLWAKGLVTGFGLDALVTERYLAACSSGSKSRRTTLPGSWKRNQQNPFFPQQYM